MGGVVASQPGGDKAGNVVCDLDGVVYLGQQGIAGAAEALEEMEGSGLRLFFVTNNSTKTVAELADDIRTRTGYEAGTKQILTSGMATAQHLPATVQEVFVVGGPGLVETLGAAGYAVRDEASAVDAVVVGMDRAFTFEKMAAAADAVRRGAIYMATNLDATYPTESGLLPGGGSVAAAISTASGEQPTVCGKPYEPMRALVRARLGPGPVWVVGDRYETDLAMARAEGWSGVLVLTGLVKDPALVPAEYAPDVVVASIADVPASVLAG